jgi:DNA-binding transcriptional ArsR family regulator
MTSSRHKTERQLDLIFHALSDPTRRALLAHLAHGPATVNVLVAPFAMSRPAVSKHLRVLEEASLIQRDIEGRIHRCALSAAPLRRVDQFLAAYRPFWEGTLDKLASYVERG